MAVGKVESPVSVYSPGNIMQLSQMFDRGAIIDAMVRAGAPQESADGIFTSELRRLGGVAPYHGESYEWGLRMLEQRGLVGADSKKVELASSMGMQMLSLPVELRGHNYLGIDYNPVRVAAGGTIFEESKAKGILNPEDSFNIVRGDENTPLTEGDVAMVVLGAQYIGPIGTAGWTLEHGRVGLIGDIACGASPVHPKEFAPGGRLAVRPTQSGYQNEQSGMTWVVDEEPVGVGDRDLKVARAHLELDPKILDNGESTVLLRDPKDQFNGHVTMIGLDNGQWVFFPYAWVSKNGKYTPEQAKLIDNFLQTFYQLYEQSGWDGTFGTVLPKEIERQGGVSAIRITTLNDDATGTSPAVSSMLPAASVLSNSREVLTIDRVRGFSRIGNGHPDGYGEIGQFFADLKAWPQKMAGLSFANCQFITALVSRDASFLQRMR